MIFYSQNPLGDQSVQTSLNGADVLRTFSNMSMFNMSLQKDLNNDLYNLYSGLLVFH